MIRPRCIVFIRNKSNIVKSTKTNRVSRCPNKMSLLTWNEDLLSRFVHVVCRQLWDEVMLHDYWKNNNEWLLAQFLLLFFAWQKMHAGMTCKGFRRCYYPILLDYLKYCELGGYAFNECWSDVKFKIALLLWR